MNFHITLTDQLSTEEVISLYRANDWSAAEKPEALMAALRGSHTLVTARLAGRLIGLGNAISDGHLVVYYPHFLVHPDYQGQGVGRLMMKEIQSVYADFHQQMLTADGDAVLFYETLGFVRAGKTEPIWIYAGTDH